MGAGLDPLRRRAHGSRRRRACFSTAVDLAGIRMLPLQDPTAMPDPAPGNPSRGARDPRGGSETGGTPPAGRDRTPPPEGGVPSCACVISGTGFPTASAARSSMRRPRTGPRAPIRPGISRRAWPARSPIGRRPCAGSRRVVAGKPSPAHFPASIRRPRSILSPSPWRRFGPSSTAPSTKSSSGGCWGRSPRRGPRTRAIDTSWWRSSRSRSSTRSGRCSARCGNPSIRNRWRPTSSSGPSASRCGRMRARARGNCSANSFPTPHLGGARRQPPTGRAGGRCRRGVPRRGWGRTHRPVPTRTPESLTRRASPPSTAS